jgi:ribose/xylose/arabinose/galactoside ABC-type transport system permease subunit
MTIRFARKQSEATCRDWIPGQARHDEGWQDLTRSGACAKLDSTGDREPVDWQARGASVTEDTGKPDQPGRLDSIVDQAVAAVAPKPRPGSHSADEHKTGILRRIFGVPEVGIFIPLVLICIGISIKNPTFYSQKNIILLLTSMSYTGIIAIAMTYVFVAAGLDLSVGAVAGLAGIVACSVMKMGVPIWLSVLLGLFVGAVVGLTNGTVVVRLRIPSFIVTLGMMNIVRGVINIITGGVEVDRLPKAFDHFGEATVLRMPYSVLIMLALAVVGDFVLRKTTYGRSIYAVGGNEEVAGLAGIAVKRTKISTYILVSAAAAASGILLAARLGSATAASGIGWEMTAISAVIIGGTSMFGGVGTILGVMIGAATMSVLSNGMVLVDVNPYWQDVVFGVIMVLAVGLDQLRRSRLGL